jgi:hypothetical protein
MTGIAAMASPRQTEMGKHHLLIVGAARDCGASLSRTIAAIGAACQDFGSVSWFVVESDSSDDTLDQLHALSSAVPRFRYVSLGKLRDQMPLRSSRVSAARNRCLTELESHPEYGNTSMVAIADLDEVNWGLTPAGVASCFSRARWDVCAANQSGPYYDLWALRHPMLQPVDCWVQYRYYKSIGMLHDEAKYIAVYSRRLVIPPDHDWIEVESAFGGFALYRREVLSGVEYRGVDNDGVEVCEHVAFHARLRSRGAKIFINPALVNTEWTHYTLEMKGWRRFKIEVRRALRIFRAGIQAGRTRAGNSPPA